MSSTSGPTVLQAFKKVYGDLKNLISDDYMFQRDIPFNEAMKVGDSYVEAVVLTAETGWSILGNSGEMHELEPAIAGAVRQTEIKPYETVLASLIPWAVISRTAGGSEKAFFSATKHIVKNNIRSHGKLLEILRIYGQASMALGYVSYATASYRGVNFTNGTQTLNGIAFTNGVNIAQKKILFAPGNFAAGIWVGTEGAIIQQIDANGVVVGEGKLMGVDASMGVITVDFAPVPTTSTTSHRICFKGQATKRDAPGIINILSESGTLFGISTTQFSLWKGNVVNLGGTARLTLGSVQSAIADAVNRGSLDGDIDIYLNPRSWAKLLSDEVSYRRYDSNKSTGEMSAGSEALTFYSQTGKIRIHSHRFIMEGMALALHLDDWTRSGSAEISFTVPGSNQELIFPLQNSTAWAFRSYSDQYIFCHAPAKSTLFIGINDEVA